MTATAMVAIRTTSWRCAKRDLASHPPMTTAMPKKMNVVARAPTSLASVDMFVSSASGYVAATTAGR